MVTSSRSPLRLIFLAAPFLLASLPPSEARAEALSRGDAVRLAIERNPAVEAARQAWEAALARARLAGALPDPELEMELEEVPALGSPGDYGERIIGLGQRVEFPLKWWHRRQAGRRQAEAVRLSILETARLDMRLRARRAYDRVVLQETVLLHTRRDRELAGEILRQARIRFEAGDVPELDAIQAGVEAGRADNRLTAAASALDAARKGLNALLARPLDTPFTLSDSRIREPLEAGLGELREAALRQRPELAGAAMSLGSLRSRQAAATASWWPDLHLGLGRMRQHGDHVEDSWRVSLAAEVPLWAFSRQRAEVAEARAEAARVEAEGEALRYQVLLETEEAWLDLKAAAGQAALFDGRILPGTERALTVAVRSYEEGQSTYLELLEARRTWVETRIEYARALFEYRAAEAALERAVGGPLPGRGPAED